MHQQPVDLLLHTIIPPFISAASIFFNANSFVFVFKPVRQLVRLALDVFRVLSFVQRALQHPLANIVARTFKSRFMRNQYNLPFKSVFAIIVDMSDLYFFAAFVLFIHSFIH